MRMCENLSDSDRGQVVIAELPEGKMAAGCTMGKRQAGTGTEKLRAMLCWETFVPGIHVDLCPTT